LIGFPENKSESYDFYETPPYGNATQKSNSIQDGFRNSNPEFIVWMKKLCLDSG